jgi:hypothetical protein
MAAPKGNQFWRLRSTHGRDKLFVSADLLWEAASEYFNWVDSHPWYKVEAIKSGDKAGDLLKIPTPRPYTISGLLLYVGASESYWRDFKRARHDGFSSVIEEIENAIYTQKFEGAAVGAFNSNIIARDLGLTEKNEFTGKGGGPIQTQSVDDIDYDSLSDEVLEQIALARRKKGDSK